LEQVEQPRYTYVLRSPVDNVPVYVGMGGWARVTGHKHRYQPSAIGAYVRDLESRGLNVSRELAGPFTRDEAYEFEELLIDEIGRRDIGTGPLLNMRSGGSRVRQSEATKAKISASHMGKTLSAEHKASVSRTLTGRKQSSELKQRHSIRMKQWWEESKAKQNQPFTGVS
jgi:hypothetical protein